ncbi:MAG TPA: hypothetical protein VFY28_01890 [Candidatus Paceibacterota bacterium]|nr:hypothetical protein [Candidatus Paceibacterota bacterium]
MQALLRALILVCVVAFASIPTSADAKKGSRAAWARSEKLEICGVGHRECDNAFVRTDDGLYLVPHDMTMEEVYLEAGDHIAKQGSASWFMLGLIWMISRYWIFVAIPAVLYAVVRMARRGRPLAST